MKQETRPLRRAHWLLLAAAALPSTPLAAQEAQPPADAPAATAQPPEAQAPPVPDDNPPAAEPAASPAAQREPAAAPAPRRVRAAPRAAVRVAPPAPVYVDPAPVVATVPAAPPATVVTTPPAAVISTTTTPAPVDPTMVETLPTTPSNGVDVVPVETVQEDNSKAIWPWLLLLGLAAVAAVLLLTRRRRGATVVEREELREEPLATLAPAAPLAPLAPVTPVAAARPRLTLALRPHRAGVAADGARVEFELTVDNRGDAAAEDVRVATWMLAAGASDAERALIEPADRADTPPVTIEAGQSRTMEAAVALASSEVRGGSILPVVVADARYRLPDGSEGHTRASYAVGVLDGETLMHFDTDQPSGLHEGVVAQAVGTPRSI
jgi:hypothetical protein